MITEQYLENSPQRRKTNTIQKPVVGVIKYSFSKNSSPYVIPSEYFIFLKWSTPCHKFNETFRKLLNGW